MTDKARAHNDETLGDYVYGENSGLDCKILGFLSISADDFAEAADEYGDDALSGWMLEKSGKTQAEIDEFNQTELSHEPDTAEARERLRARLEKYAPGRTDIKTAIQSMELDDWGEFWQVDLTQRPPRSPYCKDVAGIFGVARMADKARAARAGRVGEYKYGEDSGTDRRILGFLGLSPEEFQEAAVNNPNSLELGAWVLEKSGKQLDEITDFNRAAASRNPEDEESRAYFNARLQQIDPSRTDIQTWADLMDLDDELSFGIVDLARHAPRSPYNTDVGGLIHLARMVDKARAYNSDSLGEYWYGEDSGADRNLLAFLDISPEEFAEALKGLPTDADVANWLKTQSPKTESEIADYNEEAVKMGPTNDRQRAFLAKVINKLDPSRTDIQTFFELMVLDDQKSFV
jgi:hypothetical protein